jgi:hypothetical protein
VVYICWFGLQVVVFAKLYFIAVFTKKALPVLLAGLFKFYTTRASKMLVVFRFQDKVLKQLQRLLAWTGRGSCF